jgi:hypothetical protein
MDTLGWGLVKQELGGRVLRRPQFWGHVQSTYPLIVKRSPQFWGNFGDVAKRCAQM